MKTGTFIQTKTETLLYSIDMKYIIADKALSSFVGFNISTHRTNNDKIILNEKELVNNKCLEGTLEERAKAISGTVYTHTEIINKINEGGWNE